MKRIDLKGQKFGRLIVIEGAYLKKRKYYWLCVCECGNKKIVEEYKLKIGNTKSCGCLKKELNTKHGYYKHPLYYRWVHMIERCYNKKHVSYKDYGGRGIGVCDEWKNSPKIFIEWAINHGWERNLQIDRIDNNGNYESSNCRFISSKLNSHNRRSTKLNELLVKDIKIRLKNGERSIDIANIYKLNKRMISDIKMNKRWADVKI